jgi:hypothetical protein
MMRFFHLDQLSPAQLALAQGFGAFLIPISNLFLYLARHRDLSDRAWIAAGILCLILGLVIFWRADSQLTEGTRNQRWTDNELQDLRSMMQLPFWSYLLVALFAGQVAPFIISPHHLNVGQCLLIPSIAILRIRFAVRPPKDSPSPYPLWGASPRPIHSDHWGER